jgi:hypothetical protein
LLASPLSALTLYAVARLFVSLYVCFFVPIALPSNVCPCCMDKCIAELPSRGVGITALSLGCSVRLDSCCSYFLPLLLCSRPGIMACGIPRIPIIISNTRNLSNTNNLTSPASCPRTLCTLIPYRPVVRVHLHARFLFTLSPSILHSTSISLRFLPRQRGPGRQRSLNM